MYKFINRFYEPGLKNIAKIDRGEVEDLDPLVRERKVIRSYRAALSNVDPSIRTAYVRVKSPQKERVNYQLVYVTKHPKGINVFMKESEKAERKDQPIIRAAAANRSSSQATLFSVEEVAGKQSRVPKEDLRRFWLEILSEEPKKFTEDDLAEFLEKTDCFPGELQEALGDLKEENLVKNLDQKGSRRKNHVDFEKGERLKSVQTNGEHNE
jgi:hypothetical protein